MRVRQQQTWIWIIVVLLLATVVRLNGIDAQSFWIDEGFTWNLTQYGDLFEILRRDVHPPLYFLMIDTWVEFTGTSTFAMRYFSLLPSVLSVAVVYQLAREIQRQQNITIGVLPVIAMCVMAVAEAETFLSQEARSYTWHVLFTCMSMFGFLRWGRTDERQSYWLWIISTIALIYTFYLGAFIGVVQGIYALLFLRAINKKTQAVAGLILCAMTLLPWLLLTGNEQSDNISRAEWIRSDAFSFWLDDFRTKYFTRQWALMLALFIAGLFTIDRKQFKVHPTSILLLLWFGVPLLLTLILNEQIPTYQPRRVSQIVPAIVLLTALGIGHLRGYLRWVVVGIVVFYGTFSTDFWRYKQPWRDMVADTVHLIADNTPMLFELGGDDYAPRYHYGEALDNSFDFLLDDPPPADNANVLIGLTTWRHLQPDMYQGSLPAILDSQDHWWFFYWSSDTGALGWFDTFGFERTATISVDFNPDVFLYRYDRLPDTTIIEYSNGLTLRDTILHDDFTVELLWSTSRPITIDYTTAVFLFDANDQVVAQVDSQPFLGTRPMSRWAIGDIIFDPKQLIPNQTVLVGEYTIMLEVYTSVDGEINQLETETGESRIVLGTISQQND